VSHRRAIPWLSLLVATPLWAQTAPADPFNPGRLVRPDASAPFATTGSLARTPTDQWRLVGTISQQGQRIGLVEDPEQRVHLLAPGARIDEAGLEVVRIGADELFLRDVRPGRHGRMIHLRLERP
jgi:hypothetical protein